MKLRHSERKEIMATTVTRNAFTAAAILTGTLAAQLVATAQDSANVADSAITQAPRMKGDFQIEKMVFGIRPAKTGDTLFVATNLCDFSDRVLLIIDEVQDSGVVIASLKTSAAGKNSADPTAVVRTVAYGEERQVGTFRVKAEKGPEPGTARVEYVITPGTGCSESK